MNVVPPIWTRDQLAKGIEESADVFRQARFDEPAQRFRDFYNDAKVQIENLLTATSDLARFKAVASEVFCDSELAAALRYIAAPPLSVDDLETLAGVSMSTAKIKADGSRAVVLAETILRSLDSERFPWVSADRGPTAAERDVAVVATASLMAQRRTETSRRTQVKNAQEDRVKKFLVAVGFVEVPPRNVTNLSLAPDPGQFCGEVFVGTRRSDIPVRLWDGRLMAIECKVSNSATNSYKRINNDAAVKAQVWKSELGSANVVPAAVISGVYALANLVYAQERGLTLWWAHDLDPLREFIDQTKP